MCSGRSNRPVCSTLARSVLASSGASDAVSTVVAVTRPPKPPPRTIDIFMTVSIAPWLGRTAGAANGSREDADLPPGVADVFLLLAAVAVNHLHAVPAGVVVVGQVVDRGDQLQALPVDAVALEDVQVEVVGGAGAFVGLVDRRIGGRRVPLAPLPAPGKVEVAAVLGVVHRAPLARCDRRRARHEAEVG